jgi:hypothetical protein
VLRSPKKGGHIIESCHKEGQVELNISADSVVRIDRLLGPVAESDITFAIFPGHQHRITIVQSYAHQTTEGTVLCQRLFVTKIPAFLDMHAVKNLKSLWAIY